MSYICHQIGKRNYMNSLKMLCTWIGMLCFVCANGQSVKVDTLQTNAEDEIKLNEEAVRSIVFDFSPDIRPEPKASVEKPWLEFSTELPKEFIRNERPELEMKMEFDMSMPNGNTQPLATFDADKLLFENFTKRGRAIKRNRKRAKAWKLFLENNDSTERKEDMNDSLILSIVPKDTLPLLHEDKINRQNEADKSGEMIPLQGLSLEENRREYSKDN